MDDKKYLVKVKCTTNFQLFHIFFFNYKLCNITKNLK